MGLAGIRNIQFCKNKEIRGKLRILTLSSQASKDQETMKVWVKAGIRDARNMETIIKIGEAIKSMWIFGIMN